MKQPKIYSILPKLLHRTPEKAKELVKPDFTTPIFSDKTMDFYVRKVLKHNGIKYQWHKKERILTVNYTGSPFKFFMIFDDSSNYITIRKIPWDNFEYKINAITVESLLDKMIKLKIIYLHNLKNLIVPMNLKAQQLQLIYG